MKSCIECLKRRKNERAVMTKSLVINCSLKSKNEALVEAVKKFSECTVVQFRNIQGDYRVGGDIDAVVISGSGARIVDVSDRAMFEGVEQLIRTCNLPILRHLLRSSTALLGFRRRSGIACTASFRPV